MNDDKDYSGVLSVGYSVGKYLADPWCHGSISDEGNIQDVQYVRFARAIPYWVWAAIEGAIRSGQCHGVVSGHSSPGPREYWHWTATFFSK